jgi:hypothetical protein
VDYLHQPPGVTLAVRIGVYGVRRPPAFALVLIFMP